MSKWIRVNNNNYSPFDGSSPYLYICPNCDIIKDDESNFCPKCGQGMRDNMPCTANMSPSWIITAVNLIGCGEMDAVERGNMCAYKVGTCVRIDIKNYSYGGK